MQNKVKSFTLAELLVVMIVTAIVVGLAFTVLRMIRKQVHIINNNLDRSATLGLFEQKLWQDLNEYNRIQFDKKRNILAMSSEVDSVTYYFAEGYIIRKEDTVKLNLVLEKVLFEGTEILEGEIDALSISADSEFPDYKIFLYKKNDATLLMDTDGF